MQKWNTPVLEVLDITMTENGAVPATYESNGAWHMMIDGERWCIINGYLWESGADMNGYTTIERPYQTNGDGSKTYYG